MDDDQDLERFKSTSVKTQRYFSIWFNLINIPLFLFYKRALCPFKGTENLPESE